MVETIEYIICSVCGRQVLIKCNSITGHYEGECRFCRKWFGGFDTPHE